jgi:hypothetical protein
MRDVPVGVSEAQFIVHNDVLGRSKTEAFALVATIEQQGRAVSGGRLKVRLLGGADGLPKHAVR